MENGNSLWGGDGIFALVIFLIVAGLFTNGGFGFGGNATRDITNEFLFNNLSNDVRANGQAINTTDRDVLMSSCNTDKEILENRYQNAVQTQTLSSQASTNALQAQANLSSCCCELKSLVRDEVQSIKDLINANTIQDLRDTKQGYELVSALGNQTNTLSQRFGTWYPNPPFSPYYYGTYGTYGTTII